MILDIHLAYRLCVRAPGRTGGASLFKGIGCAVGVAGGGTVLGAGGVLKAVVLNWLV